MPDLLIEIYSEEIPSSLQKPINEQLKNKLLVELKEAKVPCGHTSYYSSPQRTAIIIRDIPWQTEDQKVETRGPRVGAPDKAVSGFLKSKSKKFEDLEVRSVGQAEYLFLTENLPGTAINEILQQIIISSLGKLSLPKSMYWGAGRTKWVRPIQSLLGILYDEEKTEIVPFEFAGLTAGNTTFGHRFMSPDEMTINSFDDYKRKLMNSFVIIDPETRKDKILETIQMELGSQYPDLELVHDDELLDEIVGLVEWPIPLLGEIDAPFQELPEEVLKTTIKVHQKYLSVRDTVKGKITNFITVANFKALDDGYTIINGNQRVLASRLSDAQFFLNEDIRKFPVNLLEVAEELRSVRYSYGLGTQKDRVDRIEKLSRRIALKFSCTEEDASQAAQLSKIDLVTHMVKEFPELQGVMGRYYGNKQGINPDICEAIEEHYLPAKILDRVPSNPISITIGLADRINHLVGFFLRREMPTGLGDPNALRRAALGIIRLILNNNIQGFYLRKIISYSIDDHFESAASTEKTSRLELKSTLEEKTEVTEAILAFILRRLSIYLVDKGFSSDFVDACVHVPNNDDLFDIVKRVETLVLFLPTHSGTDLLHLDNRISRILISLKTEPSEDKSIEDDTLNIDPSLFQSSFEEALYGKFQYIQKKFSTIENDNYLGKLEEVSNIRKTVDEFFDNVMIRVDDQLIKNNRLNLLRNIRKILIRDFNLGLVSSHEMTKDSQQ